MNGYTILITLASLLVAGDGLPPYPSWFHQRNAAALAKCDDDALAAIASEAILPYRGDLSTEERSFLAGEFSRRRTAQTQSALDSLQWRATATGDGAWLTLTVSWDASLLDLIALTIPLDRVRVFDATGNELALASQHGTLEVPLASGRDTAAIPLRVRGGVPARIVLAANVLFAAVPHRLELDITSPQRWRGLPLRCGDTTFTLHDVKHNTDGHNADELSVTWSLAFRSGAGSLDSHRLAWLTANASRPLAELLAGDNSSPTTLPPTTLRLVPQNENSADITATFRFPPATASPFTLCTTFPTGVEWRGMSGEWLVTSGE